MAKARTQIAKGVVYALMLVPLTGCSSTPEQTPEKVVVTVTATAPQPAPAPTIDAEERKRIVQNSASSAGARVKREGGSCVEHVPPEYTEDERRLFILTCNLAAF
ncbi:hypothetical protein OG753_03345 [Streptomyces sp. NBC_00029]|uniref:hypothetical protein n=1 Tax=Streptomyces sp. NBC_00029 TaxID=2903613 RepID=UPI003255C179